MKKEKLRKSSLRVLNDRVLVKPDEPKGYEGTLAIPDAYEAFYKNLPDTGTIVSFGEACKHKWVVGQHIHFAKMAATKCEHDSNKYLVLREYDVDYVIKS